MASSPAESIKIRARGGSKKVPPSAVNPSELSAFTYDRIVIAIDQKLRMITAARRGSRCDQDASSSYCTSFGMTHQKSSPTRKNLTPNELSVNTRKIDRLPVGADASTPWCLFICSGIRYLDMDPTNNVVLSNGHVTLTGLRALLDPYWIHRWPHATPHERGTDGISVTLLNSPSDHQDLAAAL